MIASCQRNELLSIGRSSRVLILDEIADGRIDRILAAEREVDVPQRAGRELHQPGREADGRLRAEMKVAGRVREARHLLRSGVHYAVLSVADVDAPQPGKRIKQLIPLSIAQIRASPRLEDRRTTAFVLAKADDRVNEVISIEILQGCFSHDAATDPERPWADGIILVSTLRLAFRRPLRKRYVIAFFILR